jgi:TRAP-type C4-dicarboxylate transport system permease small subunit
MVVLVFGNVVLRYAFNSGITVSEELSRWLFVWLTFLGAVIALAEGRHLGSDMLVSKLGIKGKKICFLVGHLLMLYATWLLFLGSFKQMVINMETSSAVMEVPMAIFYGAGGTASVLVFLILVNQLWKLLTGTLSENELVGIRESEDEPVEFSGPVK